MSSNRFRQTIRVRLTLLYGLSFVIAGAVLVAIEYLLVRNQLQPSGTRFSQTIVGAAPPPGSIVGQPKMTQSIPQGDEKVLIGSFQRFVDHSLSTLLWQSLLVLAFAVVIAIAVGWVLAGSALAPLQTVTATAQRVSARGLHERIGMLGPQDEVKDLADTFDAMLDRLDRAFDAQRRFVGNASHELRTPLAINRTLLEVAAGDPENGEEIRRLAGPLLANNERSERLIDGLLLLARSEQQVVAREPLDFADVARIVVEQTRAEAARRGIDLRVVVRPAPTAGESVLLEQLMVNLVQNAVRHNTAGGWAEVVVGATADAVVVTVANSGPVVAPYEVAQIFEPFRRLAGRVASGTQGSGLGLSIVRAVVLAHGGTVVAVPREGGGLVVTVTLPGGH